MPEPFIFFKQQALFSAGIGGYALYRIPGVVSTPAGGLLMYCEARKHIGGDWGSIDVLLRRSSDGGQTWSAPQQMNPPGLRVARNPAAVAKNLGSEGECTFNNPVAIADRQAGLVHFVFCAEYAHCFYMRSSDDGQTWDEPVEITAALDALRAHYPWRVVATGPGHAIQRHQGPYAGRLIVPVWLSDGSGGHAHRPSVVTTLYSDDSGTTWQVGEIAAAHGPVIVNPSETMAAELADGRVMLNMRNEGSHHRRMVTTSHDGARGWSQPTPDEGLFEPVCAAGLVRVPGETGGLLFSHPDSARSGPPTPDAVSWKRENLTVRLSQDEGQTWPFSKVIAPGIAGYSDLAFGPGDRITCAYESGSLDGDHYATAHLMIAQFNLAWLKG